MITYQNGIEARGGDAVLLGHGVHPGRVLHIIEFDEDIKAWNVEKPGIMVDTTYGGRVFYAAEFVMDDDEVRFVSRKKA